MSGGKLSVKEINERLRAIKIVAVDCDGVLTDGGIYYDNDGPAMRKFNALDGIGFERLQENGIITAIITKDRAAAPIERRGEKLRVNHVVTNTHDKLSALKDLCKEYGFELSQAVYMGDDYYDVPAIEAAGLGCAPPGALPTVQERADYVTERAGGCGCFREIVEMLLLAQGKI